MFHLSIRSVTNVTRFKPLDRSTLESRSKERWRRIALTTVGSGGARGVSILVGILSVPLLLQYLGAERYGLWMTISSVIALLGCTDLGLSNGLLNAVSEAHGRDDHRAAAEYVASAFFLLLAIALVMVSGFVAICPWVSWTKLFHISSTQATAEVGPALFVFIGCLLAGLPLAVIPQAQAGYQEGFLNTLWEGLGSLLALAGIYLSIFLNAGLPWLVLAIMGAPVVTGGWNGLVLFGFRRPWLRPRWQRLTSRAIKKVFRLGLFYLVLQIAVFMNYSSDNLIAAHCFGPAAVTEYAVTMKLFSLQALLSAIALAPLWPAYGEAMARGDYAWVKKTFIRSLWATFLFSMAGAILLLLFGTRLLELWVGPQVQPSFLLLAGCGAWSVIGACGNALAMFLNGVHVLRLQMVIALTVGVTNLGLTFLLISYIGLAGIIWGTVLAYVLFAAIPYAVIVPRLLKQMQQPAVAIIREAPG